MPCGYYQAAQSLYTPAVAGDIISETSLNAYKKPVLNKKWSDFGDAVLHEMFHG